jgi:hypothetical protein
MDYIDWSKAERASFPDLKPTARTISVRLPVTMIANLSPREPTRRSLPVCSENVLADRLKEEIAPQRRVLPAVHHDSSLFTTIADRFWKSEVADDAAQPGAGRLP